MASETLHDYAQKLRGLSPTLARQFVPCPVLVRIRGDNDSTKVAFHTDHIDVAQLVSQSLAPRSREVILVKKRGGSVFSGLVGVGRTQNVDICIPHNGISKFHAHFSLDDGGNYLLTDKASKNGTYVDDRPLTPGTPVSLSDHAQVRFGTHCFTFMHADTFIALAQRLDDGQA